MNLRRYTSVRIPGCRPAVFVAFIACATAAQADSFTDFEPAGFVDGTSVHDIAPDGTTGVGISFINNCVSAWFVPGGTEDEEIVDLADGDHEKVWRLSQAVDCGTTGQCPHSANSGTVTPLTAGETGAANDAGCGAPTTANFYAEFDFRSVTGVPEPGLKLAVSANSGDQRHGFMYILDDGAGALDLTFFETADGCNTFPSTVIDSNIPYGEWHKVAIEISFVDGLASGTAGSAGAEGNDVVNIYIDNILVHTGTSWESCVGAESVDRLLFETRDEDVSHDGKGLYFDNVLVADVCPSGKCLAEPPPPIPAMTQWGMGALVLLLLAGIAIKFESTSVNRKAA